VSRTPSELVSQTVSTAQFEAFGDAIRDVDVDGDLEVVIPNEMPAVSAPR